MNFKLIGLVACLNGPASDCWSNEVIETPSRLLYPNGIAVDESGALYVGFVASGEIVKKDPLTNEWVTFYSNPAEVYSTTSLRYDPQSKILWGTSPDFLKQERLAKLYAIDSSNGKLVQSIEIPSGSFANDIALGTGGKVFITDSFRPRIMVYHSRTSDLDTLVEHELFESQGPYGLSGIARDSKGRLYVGMFSDGKLLRVNEDLSVQEIELPRLLENPDGIQMLDDSRLLVLEGAVKSGNGKVSVIHIIEEVAEEVGEEVGEEVDGGSNIISGKIETLRDNMESPVNLTLFNDKAYVTESRIRHRLISKMESQVPNSFRVHVLDLL